MLEITYNGKRGFIRLGLAQLDRIAKENGGQTIRLTFRDFSQERNVVQLDIADGDFLALREKINKRKDIK